MNSGCFPVLAPAVSEGHPRQSSPQPLGLAVFLTTRVYVGHQSGETACLLHSYEEHSVQYSTVYSKRQQNAEQLFFTERCRADQIVGAARAARDVETGLTCLR